MTPSPTTPSRKGLTSTESPAFTWNKMQTSVVTNRTAATSPSNEAILADILAESGAGVASTTAAMPAVLSRHTTSPAYMLTRASR